MATGRGSVEAGGGEGEREAAVVGHSRMAAALSHILTPSAAEQEKANGRQGKRDVRRKLKKRLHHIDEESGSEGEGGSPDDVTLSTTACDVVAGCHRLPDAATLDHERRLQRIATTGVVQLFNAVSQHSKEVESKMKAAGPSERKRAKVLSTVDKGSFIDLLKGHKPQERSDKWPVLKEDYMLGARLRDWRRGKEGEGEREGEEGEGEDNSSDSDDS